MEGVKQNTVKGMITEAKCVEVGDFSYIDLWHCGGGSWKWHPLSLHGFSGDNANSVYMKTQVKKKMCICSYSLISTITHTCTLYMYVICVCTVCNVAYVSDPSPPVCLCPWCVSPLAIHFISVWIVSVFPLLLFIKCSHLLTFTSSFNNKTSRNTIFIGEDQEQEKKKKNRREKQVLWDQWCKKLFLSNAAWLTFPADTDKRMRVSRPFCVFVYVCVCVWLVGWEKEGGQENKWDYWCYMSNIIAEIWAKRRRG